MADLKTLRIGRRQSASILTISTVQYALDRVKKSKQITNRESEVLEFISLGLTNQEIATRMNLSPHTTESHRRHLMNKLEARNKANLVRIGMEHGLI